VSSDDVIRRRELIERLEALDEKEAPKITPLAGAYSEQGGRRGDRYAKRDEAIGALFPHQEGAIPVGEVLSDVTGWVYFAGAYDRGRLVHVKIGYTAAKNPTSRIKTVGQGVPHEVRLLVAVPGCRTLELQYLAEFRRTHIKGEWFEPSGEIMTRVETLLARQGTWKPGHSSRRRRGRRA
jgi:hypothetical protein